MNRKTITCFEHESLTLAKLEHDELKALQKFYGNGIPYFSLIHNGIKFCEFVGVLQVGNTVIEVLPKADKNSTDEDWRNMLIAMLRSVGSFDVHAPTSSSLNLKPNAILELYYELFINEVEYLLHRGLLKKYRKTSSNLSVLKGAIKFNRHLQFNLTHKERFFVEHTTYDVEHKIHFILYKALTLLGHINTSFALQGRISALLLNFPEMPDIKVSEDTFSKLHLGQKAQPYSKALDIARLLLLNYHPDVTSGPNHILALMFDMNILWESFIYQTLRKQLKKHRASFTITAQTSKYFWKAKSGRRTSMRPDIVINTMQESCVVIDTKWKNLGQYNPSPDDLRQMYVYHDYFRAKKVALVYPGTDLNKTGIYLHHESQFEVDKECSIIGLPVKNDIQAWEKAIFERILEWFDG